MNADDGQQWFVALVPDHLFISIHRKMQFDWFTFIAQIGGIFGIIIGGLKVVKSTTVAIGWKWWCCKDHRAKLNNEEMDALKNKVNNNST
jgi:hypothetical protein